MRISRKMIWSGPATLAFFWAALAALALSSPARTTLASDGGKAADSADAVVDAEVKVIHATNDADGGIDPRVGKLPNIGSYKSYRLLSQTNVSIKKSAPTTTTLPNGRILQISLKGVKDQHFIIDTSINQPGGTAFLPLLEVRAVVDTPVFIAGQTYQNGMLIIAIKILPK